QKKKKKKTKKRKSKQAPARVNLSAEQADEMWQAMASELSSWIQGHNGTIPESVVPFDAASDIPIDQQRVSALSRIQTQLQNCEYGESIALLRAARLACPSILQPYCWLLGFYRENSAKTNHYLVKMLHRVAVDLKMVPMMFQLSLFVTFNRVLHDPAASQYKEMVKFARYILGNFFEMLPKNPVLCVELSTWKTTDACYEISEGYGSLQNRRVLGEVSMIFCDQHKSLKKSGATWSYEEEEELKSLYHQYQEGEDDVIDKILDNLQDDTRTRRQQVFSANCTCVHRPAAKKGLQEQLEWIQSQLRRVAEDREDGDNWQAYPLVTITEENEEALSNSQFRAMLKKIGLVPPVTGQQTFWRIPIGMRPAQLRQAADELEGKRHTECATSGKYRILHHRRHNIR
ncbi:predicted protein, partial [Nematostella vectensis]